MSSSFFWRDSSFCRSASRRSVPRPSSESERRMESISASMRALPASRLETIVLRPFMLLAACAICWFRVLRVALLLSTSLSSVLHCPDSFRRYSSVLWCLRCVSFTLSPRWSPHLRFTAAKRSCRASVRRRYSYLSPPTKTLLKEMSLPSVTGIMSAWMCGLRSSRCTTNDRMFSSPNLPARTSYISFAQRSISGRLWTEPLLAPFS